MQTNKGKFAGFLIFSILFPPLSVIVQAGCTVDFVLTCIFLVAGVGVLGIAHAIYVTIINFDRKDKVARGVPITRRAKMIFSEKIQRGGRNAPPIVELGRVPGERDLENDAGDQTAGATDAGKKGATVGGGPVENGESVCCVGGENLDGHHGEVEEHRASLHSREAAVEHEEHQGQDGS